MEGNILPICPKCGSFDVIEIPGSERDVADYDNDSKAMMTSSSYKCRSCGEKFDEMRKYGTYYFSSSHFDDTCFDEENYTMFIAVPEAEYLNRLLSEPDHCKSPTQVKLEKASGTYRPPKRKTDRGGDTDNLDSLLRSTANSDSDSLDALLKSSAINYDRKYKRGIVRRIRVPRFGKTMKTKLRKHI